MKSIKLKIKGMSCGGCARGIKHALEMRELVKNAKVDFDSSNSEIEFDEKKVKKKEIVEAIIEMGYKVEEIKE